jgi:hypothetical protein
MTAERPKTVSPSSIRRKAKRLGLDVSRRLGTGGMWSFHSAADGHYLCHANSDAQAWQYLQDWKR